MATSETLPRYETNLAVMPGEFLRQELEARGVTQAELAIRMGRPPQLINEILQGKKAITADTAIELESVLGLSATLWTNLEEAYRLTLARAREQEVLNGEIPSLDAFPVAWLRRIEAIPHGVAGIALVKALRSFFGVATLSQAFELNALPRYRATGSPDGRKEGALAAWLRLGDIHFEGHQPGVPYDEAAFKAVLVETRKRICDQPASALPYVGQAWSRAGVCVALTPEPPGVGVNGCTRWVDDFGLVQINLRWRWADIFWFTLFHEAHHVLQHRKRKHYSNLIDAEDEAAADTYAAEVLIPAAKWARYRETRAFDAAGILRFAESLSVPAGVVVGRLQHEGLVAHSRLNSLRIRWEWS
jgi:addiction module HigA family antidote